MKKNILIIILMMILILVACSDEDLGSDDYSTNSYNTGIGNTNLNQYLSNLNHIVQPDIFEHPVVIGLADTNLEGGYIVITKTYKASIGFNEQIVLDPTSDIIWPGSIIKGDSIRSGEYIPIVGKRAPITLSISLENLNGNKYREVSEARLSKVRQAIGSLLSKNVTGTTPARVSFTVEDIHSEDFLKMAIGGYFGNGFHNIESQFNFSNSRVNSRVLVKFIQVYYTIDIDLPFYAGEFFDITTDWDYLLWQIGSVSPLYISSISYGRMVLFSFESTEEADKLKTAINYSYNGIMSDGGVNVDLSYKNIINNCTIKALIIGGNGTQAVGSISGYNGLKNYINTGGSYNNKSPGAPLMFKLRYLSDNAICNMVYTSEYKIREKIRIQNKFEVKDLFLECLSEDDSGNNAEFYGKCHVSAFIGYENRSNVQGFEYGIPVNGTVWDVSSSGSDQWSLSPGEKKYFYNNIDFNVNNDDINEAYLRISATIKECDTFKDDSLGTKTMFLKLSDVSDGEYYLSGFGNDGTSARIGFVINSVK